MRMPMFIVVLTSVLSCLVFSPCSLWAGPLQCVQTGGDVVAAINSAGPGDVVEISPGEYELTGSISRGSDQGGITIRPKSGGETACYDLNVQPIWDAKCVVCHSGAAPLGGLALDDGVSFMNMVSVPSAQATTMNLVEPGSTEDSYLWHKLVGTHGDVGGFGCQMPRAVDCGSGQQLSNQDLEAIESWINDGFGTGEVTLTFPNTIDWNSTIQPGVAQLFENGTHTIQGIHFKVDVTGLSNVSGNGQGISIFKKSGGPDTDVTVQDCTFEYVGTPATYDVFNAQLVRLEGGGTTRVLNCHFKWDTDSVVPGDFGSFENNLGIGGTGASYSISNCVFDSVATTNGKFRSIGAVGGDADISISNCVFRTDNNAQTSQQAWISAAAGNRYTVDFCDFQEGAGRQIGHDGGSSSVFNGCVFHPGGDAFLPDPNTTDITVNNCVLLQKGGGSIRSAVFCCENEVRAYTFRNCTFVDDRDVILFKTINFAPATEFSNCLFNMPNNGSVIVDSPSPTAEVPTGSNNLSNGGGGDGEAVPGLTVATDLGLDVDGYHLIECSPAIGSGVDLGLTHDVDGDGRPQPGATNPAIGADEGPEGEAFEYDATIQPIWDANCVGCHGSAFPSSGLSLVLGVSHASMVDVPSGQATSMDLVEPGSTESSYLWHKLVGTHGDVPGGFGCQMPRVADCGPGLKLSDEDLATIEAWINDGAEVVSSGDVVCAPVFRRGDCDQSGKLDFNDAIFHLRFLFLGENEPEVESCRDACDSDDSGSDDFTDDINSLRFLFLGQGAIPSPGPLPDESHPCGIDPTDDDPLSCEGYSPAIACP